MSQAVLAGRPARPATISLALCLIVLAAIARAGVLAVSLIAWFGLDRQLSAASMTVLGPVLAWQFLTAVLLPLIFAELIRRGDGWPRYAYAILKLFDLTAASLAILHARPSAALIVLIELAAVVLLFLPAAQTWFQPVGGAALRPNAAKSARPRYVTLTVLLTGIAIVIATAAAFRGISTYLAGAPSDDSSIAYEFVGFVLGAALVVNTVIALALLAVMWTGRDWARFAFLVLAICWVPFVLMFAGAAPPLFSLAMIGLAGCVILLFTTPSNRWFKASPA